MKLGYDHPILTNVGLKTVRFDRSPTGAVVVSLPSAMDSVTLPAHLFANELLVSLGLQSPVSAPIDAFPSWEGSAK